MRCYKSACEFDDTRVHSDYCAHFESLAAIPFPHLDIRSIDEFLDELSKMP